MPSKYSNQDFSQIHYLHAQLGNAWFSGELLATLAGSGATETTVNAWLDKLDRPDDEQLNRLRFAYRLFSDISRVHNPSLASRWFYDCKVGSDKLPLAEAIASNRNYEVSAAAKRLLEYSNPQSD